MSGKAFLKFSNSSNPDYLIVRWMRFSTPLSEEDRQSYAAPHPERSLTVVTDFAEMYTFQFWQSSDGVALDTLLLSMEIDCSVWGSDVIVYEYVVDRGNSGGTMGNGDYWLDPTNGTNSVTDERLIGTSFHVEQRGVGKLRTDEYTKDAINGGWSLDNGMLFDPDDTYFAVVIKSAIVQQPVGSQTTGDYLSVIEVATNDDFDNTMYRALVDITSPSGTIVFSIPAIASIPNTKVLISTHRMGGTYCTIAFSGADTCKFLGLNKSKITLGKGEVIELLFTGSLALVLRYEGDYRRLGSLHFGRGLEINTLVLDGSLYNIADYPRLYDDFINLLPATQIKTMATWGTSQLFGTDTEYPNKGFFAVDIGAGQFRVPDFRNRSIRGLKLDVSADPTRFTDYPGGYQHDDVKPHKHLTIANHYIFANAGRGNLSANNDAVRQEANNRTNDGLQNNSGLETIPRNIGLIPQIFI